MNIITSNVQVQLTQEEKDKLSRPANKLGGSLWAQRAEFLFIAQNHQKFL